MENTKEVEKQEVKKEEVQAAARRMLRIPPSQRRVLEMDNDTLLKNYALIAHKASSLSSAQRKMVENRVGYGIKTKRFTMDDVVAEVNNLTNFVQQKIKEAENDSSTSE